MAAHDEQVEKVARAIYEAAPRRNLYYAPPISWDDASLDAKMLRRTEATAAIAAMPTAGDGWQDIASAPRDGTVIIATDGEAVQESYFANGKWRASAAQSDLWSSPTHWQPLPKPPGEKP